MVFTENKGIELNVKHSTKNTIQTGETKPQYFNFNQSSQVYRYRYLKYVMVCLENVVTK